MECLAFTADGKVNRDYWNVMKGIGALAVAIGHCWLGVQNFVYLFHVPLFFFISGFLYDEEKYRNDPAKNVAARMKSSWGKYILVYSIFILFHNTLFKLGVLWADDVLYTYKDVAIGLSKAIVGCAFEQLVSPLWFVPSLVIASAILGYVVSLSCKIKEKTKSNALKFLFQATLVIGLALYGYILASNNVFLYAYLQATLIALPYIWVGYLFRNYGKNLAKYVNGWAGLLAFVFLVYFSKGHLISLVNNLVYPYIFIVPFIGFYMCMALAKVILKFKKISFAKSSLAWMGQASFWIMAIHRPLIRLIDCLYVGLFTRDYAKLVSSYLSCYEYLVPLYLLIGVGIPTTIYYFAKRKRA